MLSTVLAHFYFKVDTSAEGPGKEDVSLSFKATHKLLLTSREPGLI